MNLYWYPDPSPQDLATAEAWIQANDGSNVATLVIGPTVVAAFDSDVDRWGASEMRHHHADLPSMLTAVVARLRRTR